MKLFSLSFLTLTSFFALFSYFHSQPNTQKEEVIKMDAYVVDQPRKYETDDGKNLYYYFTVSQAEPASVKKSAQKNEFYQVRFMVKKWGHNLGEMNYSKGSKISLTGKYSKFKALGSIAVNDISKVSQN